jgi:hypothetical protein
VVDLVWNNAESNGDTTDAIGASRDPKNPPFCKIAFFFLRETDFFVSALNPALFLLSFSFCSLVNRTGRCLLKYYRPVALCIVSMKELTLINRYHQTQERPNLQWNNAWKSWTPWIKRCKLY